MQALDQSPQALFFYFVSCATALLGCTIDIVKLRNPNTSYCEIKYYDKDSDLYQMIFELEIDKAIISCYFNEDNICDTCVLYPDNQDNLPFYTKLSHILFQYNTTTRSWTLPTARMMQIETDGEISIMFFLPYPIVSNLLNAKI